VWRWWWGQDQLTASIKGVGLAFTTTSAQACAHAQTDVNKLAAATIMSGSRLFLFCLFHAPFLASTMVFFNSLAHLPRQPPFKSKDGCFKNNNKEDDIRDEEDDDDDHINDVDEKDHDDNNNNNNNNEQDEEVAVSRQQH
jgi:hypothetical protein